MLGHGTASGKRQELATGPNPNFCAPGGGNGVKPTTTDDTETYGNHTDERYSKGEVVDPCCFRPLRVVRDKMVERARCRRDMSVARRRQVNARQADRPR